MFSKKGGSCRGVSLRDYVVLIRLSSCLMAAGRGEKTGTWLGLTLQVKVTKHDVQQPVNIVVSGGPEVSV